MITKIFKLFLGFFIYLINPLFKVKKNRWVLGSSAGKDFKEGAKYMLAFLNGIPNADACWITNRKIIKKEVNARGYRCYLNYSIKGLFYSLTAEFIGTSTSFGSDINYCFKKDSRKYIYFVHGMPHKKAIYDQPKRRMPSGSIGDRLYRKYVAGFKVSDIDYLTSTSDFYIPFLKSAFRSENVFTIGMPRNDSLFNNEMLDKEAFFEQHKEKFIITYMPTHRDYGNGEVSPFLFEHNPLANDFFRKNNILLLIKNHPNMATKVIDGKDLSNIIDISKAGFDAQTVISNTDVLITDFSSVWIDYLLLNRPIIFYFYDNYEVEDNETYFNIRNENIGSFCNDENELLYLLKKIFINYNSFQPSIETIKKHHKFMDGNSCSRLYDLVSGN